MPRDPEAFAEMVALAMKAAIAPYAERLAANDQAIRDLTGRVSELSGLRDRVTVIETKSAVVVPPPSVELVRETAIDLDPILNRLHALETKAEPTIELPPIPSAAELELSMRDRIEPVTKTLATLSERLAVVETRAPMPGPPGSNGLDGKDGKDGANGTNGADGMGWDDLSVKHDGERTFTFQMFKGDRVKDAGTFTLPVQLYRGVYTEGRTYEPGDIVSYGGSTYHCKKATVLRPDAVSLDSATGTPKGEQGRDFWTMVVRAGREGRPGREFVTPPPTVVKVG
jgi:hypothetical protein